MKKIKNKKNTETHSDFIMIPPFYFMQMHLTIFQYYTKTLKNRNSRALIKDFNIEIMTSLINNNLNYVIHKRTILQTSTLINFRVRPIV